MRQVAYSDESSWNQGRYRAVAAVSLPTVAEIQLINDANRLLAESHVREFAWKDLVDAKRRFAAKKFIDLVFRSLRTVRVDVLAWDVEDSRHARVGRDDVANLARMYYWLFKKMSERTPAMWTLRPDEHSAINWHELHDVLVHSSRRHNRRSDAFEELSKSLAFERLSPCTSHENPLVQLADLFAGMTVYSHNSFETYRQWCDRDHPTLFSTPTPRLSKSDIERCDVLSHFDRATKDAKLGVSLTTERGLRTMNPRSPINIWLWTPQHARDTAPLRRKRSTS